MTGKYLVKNAMRKDVVTAKPDATLYEAIELMIKKKTNAVVVLHTDKTIAGILTSWGLIEHLVPDYLEDDKHLASFTSSDLFAERAEWLRHHKVSEVMTTNVYTVEAGDTLMEAATQISEHHIRQLPVVDNKGHLVGYINHTDIKWAIGKSLGLSKTLMK